MGIRLYAVGLIVLITTAISYAIAAEDESSTWKENSPFVTIDAKFPALDLLPPGSVLKNVSLPQYENRKKIGVITATQMKVVNETEISGENIHIYTFSASGDQSSHLFTLGGSYFFNTQFFVSNLRTILEEARFRAVGAGLRFHSDRQVGFLMGPVTTYINTEKLDKK